MDVQVNVSQVLQEILKNASSGNKIIMASGIVLVLVYLFKTNILPKLELGNGVLPWVSIGCGLVVGVLSSIVAGVAPTEAADIALISGPGASIFWSSVVKLVTKKE